jgi:hypothetical protein
MYPGTYLNHATPELPRKPRRRVFRWVFLSIQVLFLVWVIAGASSASSSAQKYCTHQTGLDMQTCLSAHHAGTAIGVGILIALWVAVDVILGITWAIIHFTRKQARS